MRGALIVSSQRRRYVMESVSCATTALARTDSSSATSTPASGPPVAINVARACAVCGKLLKGMRPAARCCGGKCRIVLCRQRRHANLLNSLAAAEAALAQAAEAVAALRTIAEMGPHVTASLAVGGGR